MCLLIDLFPLVCFLIAGEEIIDFGVELFVGVDGEGIPTGDIGDKITEMSNIESSSRGCSIAEELTV